MWRSFIPCELRPEPLLNQNFKLEQFIMASLYPELCPQAVSRRVACHHCGNVRKEFRECGLCPQVYCRNCADKVAAEHGQDVFDFGCPVCKKLCCCATKTIDCTRHNHCYRKCPASKARVASSTNTTKSAAPNPKPCIIRKNRGSSLDFLAAACESVDKANQQQYVQQLRLEKRSLEALEQKEGESSPISEMTSSCSSSSSSSDNGSTAFINHNKKMKVQEETTSTKASFVASSSTSKSSSFSWPGQGSSSAAFMMPNMMSWVYMPMPMPVHVPFPFQPVIYPEPGMMLMPSAAASCLPPQYGQAAAAAAKRAMTPVMTVNHPHQPYPSWLLQPLVPIGRLSIQRVSAEEAKVGTITALDS